MRLHKAAGGQHLVSDGLESGWTRLPALLAASCVPLRGWAGSVAELVTLWGDGTDSFGSLQLPLAALHCHASVSLSDDCPGKLFAALE